MLLAACIAIRLAYLLFNAAPVAMAFNFNWMPLATTSDGTDSSSAAFYSHAKELLTAALNKSAKPPIIVDDIFVEDLNLGQTAPDLEILEIGDLAEDRFRGIFRMSYSGDAELTLKTRVQANPLNTYLSTTPVYTSPNPLAASSPLTIPLQITLSQFRLSGFVILVFSKAKGITLVFRNDPLESLKVSSTFDSIPFIKDYLQKEIERQVRGLFQEELPVAVHRLSLRLWNPEYAASLGLDSAPTLKTGSFKDSASRDIDPEDLFINPLLSPTDSSDLPSTLFSQKNILRLAALADSQRTLSVLTPSIRDVVFRAWASGNTATVWERAIVTTLDTAETQTPLSARSSVSGHGDYVRSSLTTCTSTLSLPPSSSSRAHTPASRRKRRHRVVNLRNDGEPSKRASVTSSEAGKSYPTTSSNERSENATMGVREVVHPACHDGRDQHETLVGKERNLPIFPEKLRESAMLGTRSQSAISRPNSPTESVGRSVAIENIILPPTTSRPREQRHETQAEKQSRIAEGEERQRPQFKAGPKYSSGILEKAFMMKLAAEMQRRLEEERERRGEGKRWGIEQELDGIMEAGEAPPAYM